MELDELKRKAEEQKAANLDLLRKRYRLAKSLGFDYGEAMILRRQPEEEIRRLAEEKKKSNKE
jgi:hypothetical protein